MTQPAAPGAPLTVTLGKDAYEPGEAVTVTVSYENLLPQSSVLTVTATATGPQGSATAEVQAGVAAAHVAPVQLTVTDNEGNAYRLLSDDGNGTAVFTTAPEGTQP